MKHEFELVTSLAEVWIETALPQPQKGQDVSLPLRKCGLKLRLLLSASLTRIVTSLAEVWIETQTHRPHYHLIIVTSLAEVWIETRQHR